MNFGLALFASKSGLTFALVGGDHVNTLAMVHAWIGEAFVRFQLALSPVETALAIALVARTVQIVDAGGAISTGIGCAIVNVFFAMSPLKPGRTFAAVSRVIVDAFAPIVTWSVLVTFVDINFAERPSPLVRTLALALPAAIFIAFAAIFARVVETGIDRFVTKFARETLVAHAIRLLSIARQTASVHTGVDGFALFRYLTVLTLESLTTLARAFGV